MRCRSSTLYLGPITVPEEKSSQLRASAPTSQRPVPCYPHNSPRSRRSAECCDERATLRRSNGIVSGYPEGYDIMNARMRKLMNTLARTDQVYGRARTRRSGIFRIFGVIVWIAAVGGGSTASGAQSN